MKNYNKGYNDTSWGSIFGSFIALLILCCIFKSCSRSEANMVLIEGRYVYDADTKIIYIETETGKYGTRTNYTEFYTENGNLCRYNIETGEFEEIIP